MGHDKEKATLVTKFSSTNFIIYTFLFFIAPMRLRADFPQDIRLPFTSENAWGVTQGWCQDSSCTSNGHCCFPSTYFGIDFNLDGERDRRQHVLAVADGEVYKVVGDVSCEGIAKCVDKNEVWGNYVIIKHSEKTFSRYAHLERCSIQVVKNQKVRQGQYMGRVGATGRTQRSVTDRSPGPHLHFQFEDENGKSIPFPGFLETGIPKSSSGNLISQNVEYLSSYSETFRVDGSFPVRPEGTFIQTRTNATVYLLRGPDNHLNAIGCYATKLSWTECARVCYG